MHATSAAQLVPRVLNAHLYHRSLCRSGMIVFKLERERPAFATHGSQLYYIKVGGRVCGRHAAAVRACLMPSWVVAQLAVPRKWQALVCGRLCCPTLELSHLVPSRHERHRCHCLLLSLAPPLFSATAQERYIRCYDFSTQRDNPLVAIRRNPSAAYNQGGLAWGTERK